MIKLAKISSIGKQSVELDLQGNMECSDCQSNCSSNFLNFLFRQNNDKMVVAFKTSELGGAHIVDKDSFFNEQHKVNDIVGMKFNENQMLRFSLLLYGLPIILLILSLIFGYVLFNLLNLNSDLGGFLGLILGLYFSKKIINHFKKKSVLLVKFFK